MKILIGVDDSAFSHNAVVSVARRPWPPGTQVRVVSAVESPLTATYETQGAGNIYEQARKAIDWAVAALQDSQTQFEVTTDIIEGSPKQVILDAAEQWGADLIVVGSHGRRGLQRFLLGSVSQAVALHANCSVEIVRAPAPRSFSSGTDRAAA